MNEKRAALLALFAEQADAWVSGADLSLALGVSRTAVWKQISALRRDGYRVEARSSRGYRLLSEPERLMPGEIQAGLNTHIIGTEVHCLEQTDSTNTQAAELAEQGAAEGTLVLAETQTAGKGRLGRHWCSPPGVNLYLSLILRPVCPLQDAPQLTFLSAVATARAVERVAGRLPELKWPNDLLLDGKKLAGLLNELQAEVEAVRWVVLGIGINVNLDVAELPTNLRYPATSLSAACGQQVSRLDLLRALLEELDSLYLDYRQNGFTPVRQAWHDLCPMVGRQVEVDLGEYRVRGQVAGLGEDGALELDLPGGRRQRIFSGDVRAV